MKKTIRIPLMLVFVSFSFNSYAAGTLTYQHYGRLNTPSKTNASDNWIQASFDGEKKKRKYGHKYNLDLRATPGDQNAIYSVTEAYAETRSGASTYAIGRKILPWQPNEKYWGTGNINGVRSFNLLEQNQEGLMGVHFERYSKRYDIGFFASYVHVPQVNPTFSDNGDGKIEGKNEWSNPPPEFVKLGETQVPINYDIQYPNLSEVLLHESIGAYGAYKWRGGKFATYATYKPENSIRINAAGYYEQSPTEQAVVKAKPFINHHFIVGGGIEQRFGTLDWKTYVDIIRPDHGKDESFKLEALKIEPVYTDETIFTTALEYKKTYFRIGANYLKLLQGDVQNTNVFAKKPKWRNAVGGNAEYYFTDKWSVLIDFKYDLSLQDSTFKNEIGYKFAKHARVGFGIELIEAPKEESFWAAYRANDSLYSNIAWIF